MITARLHGYIFRYLIDHPLGELFAAETGFREPNQQTVRAPDIAFIATDRLPSNTTGYSETMPDLVVETMSPNDTVSQTAKKTAWWLSQEGVRLVWIVDPESRQVTAHHPDGTARVVREPGVLDGGEVLPGFSLNLETLFA